MQNFIAKSTDNQIDMQWKNLKAKMMEVDKSRINEDKFKAAQIKTLIESKPSKKAKATN